MEKVLVPVEYLMQRDDRTRKYFENLMRSKHNHGRVIRVNNKIMVDPNYSNPVRLEVEYLYFKALVLTKNIHSLAKELASYSDYDDCNRLYLYMRYGSFKNYKRAQEIKTLLKLFLEEKLNNNQ